MSPYLRLFSGSTIAARRANCPPMSLSRLHLHFCNQRQRSISYLNGHARPQLPGPSTISRRTHSLHSSPGLHATTGEQRTRSEYTSAKVTVPIDGKDAEFSALLLRDLCQCPACVHESTNQKLYSTADIPPHVRARSVETSADSIRLKWKSDAPGFTDAHETVLSLDALRGLQDSGAVPNNFKDNFDRPVLWGAADAKPPDTTFKEYLQDYEAVYRVMKQLRTHGLVFITEIPHLEDALVKIATRMGPMKDTFYGYTWDVRTVPSAINAAYTSADLGFHTDLLYFDSPPHVQLLHCIQSSSFGGASVFVDAFKAAVELYSTEQDAFNTLASIRVNYHYNHPDDNLYHTTKPVFELRPLKIGDTSYTSVCDYLSAWQEKQAAGAPLPNIDLTDCLEKINWGPPFLAPFSLKEQTLQPSVPSNTPRETLNHKMDRWHAAARKFSAILHKPENLHERLMQAGECVLFDNTRVLHARRAFDAGDVGKARWLKGGYVDKDPFFSKLRVLEGKYGKKELSE